MTREYAAAGSDDYVAGVVERAPAWVRGAINRSRIAQGLRPVLGASEYARLDQAAAIARAAAEAAEGRRVGVWLDKGGKLVPVTPTTRPPRARGTWPSSSTSRPATRNGSRGPLVTRVLIVPCGGVAPASRIRGHELDEVISPVAFGDAAALNARGGFDLRHTHDGARFAIAGERLRFVDGGSIGPILEWLPDVRKPWDADALRLIEAGHDQASVGMLRVKRRVIGTTRREELVVAAELEHVALLLDSGRSAAYPGARAMVFRDSWADDPVQLKKQIDQVVARSRWHTNRDRVQSGPPAGRPW